MFVKEIRKGVTYYTYICNYGETGCRCPDGKKCSVLIGPSDTMYHINEELICGPILDRPFVIIPDTLPMPNVVIGDCNVESGGGGGGLGGGGGSGGYEGGGGGGGGYHYISFCLDTTLYEEFVGGYRIGLYFREPRTPDSTLPVVLLVHGMGANCTRWEGNLATWFPQDRYRVAAVNLFPQNVNAPPEAAGWMFHPNGTKLNMLITRLHDFINERYPGWNNKIVVVAHSRAGLEMEDVIYIRNNPYVDGVVTLGTPFYGTPMANTGVGVCNIPSYIACFPLIRDASLYFACKGAVDYFHDNVCDGISADMDILSEPAITHWREFNDLQNKINSKPLMFNIGIGWTPDWKCSPFDGGFQAGCIILRYIAWAGCNDGIVPYYSIRRRWVNNPDRTIIFSEQPSEYSPNCTGYPDIWEKDHTQVVEDFNVYRYGIQPIVHSIGNRIFRFHANTPIPFSPPRSLPDDNPVEVYSRAYITTLSDNINISLAPNEDSILVWSSTPISFNYHTPVDSQNIKSGRLYTLFPHSPSLDIKTPINVESSDTLGNYAVVIFADGDPLYLKLNKNTYREGEPIYIKLYYPFADSVKAAFVNFSPHATYRRAYEIDFYRRGDTLVSITSLPEEGVYKLIAQAYKLSPNGLMISPRTAMATVVVVRYMDPKRVIDVIMGKVTGEEKKGIKGNDGYYESTRDVLMVNIPSGSYTIYNAMGYRVKSGKFSGGIISIKSLKRGVYFVVVDNRVYKVVR